MAKQGRIYVVEDEENKGAVRLIDCASQSQAIRAVVGDRYSARIAKQLELADMPSQGIKIEYPAKKTRSKHESRPMRHMLDMGWVYQGQGRYTHKNNVPPSDGPYKPPEEKKEEDGNSED